MLAYLILPLILALITATSHGVRGYQLTNNLIANNLPPKFITSQPGQVSNSEIVVRVKEGAGSIGKLIYTLKGEDPDDDPLTFNVLGSMASDLLRIENVPGNQANVYLRKELDRETTESYQVVITLTDGKLGRGNWITKSMLIIVEDVNDNYPVFGPHRTAISIREDARPPLVVETLEASDQDEGRFGQVIYKLEELEEPGAKGAPVSSMFAIETVEGRGVLSLVGALDYEQRALYQVRVLAIDRATEQERLSASASILISVEDCDDRPPMFTFVPSITRIPENLPVGSPVVRVLAVDGDRGINNPVEYKLVAVDGHESGFERQLFSINAESGQISVAHELNRELDTFQEAAWPGEQQARAKQLEQAWQPGSYVLQVRATELQPGSGQAPAATRDNSATTELTVILTDVNDETPTFNQQFYHAELPENSTPENLAVFVAGPPSASQQQPQAAERGDPTLQAKVIDRDQGTNGTFTLHLEGEHAQLFDVWPREATNEANLMIKVSGLARLQQLDYEKTRSFTFAVVAREKFPPSGQLGAELRSNSAQVTVHLRDANDNYPQFDTDLYRVEIPENAIRGMHICSVRATDLDSGIYGNQGIRYTEIRGEKANKFKLDPLTGAVTLKTNDHGFDRETSGQHHLIVEARDTNGQGNRNTTQLLIVLQDVNDQRPKFLLDQYEAFIYENELDFQSPLQVQALDGDAPNSANSRITYSIVAGDPQQNFTIEPSTGRIQVRSSLVLHQVEPSAGAGAGAQVAQAAAGLDFERIAQKRDDTRQFNLTIKATDQGLPEPLSDTTHVIVLVYDKNDHAPVFSRNVYNKSIREDAKEGSQVLQVLAQDGDHSPTNSKITYRISSGASDKFVIDSDSGLITVASGANLDVDRAAGGQKRTNYLLSVLAFDGSFGANQKSASALVNISIVDVNNKAPEFVTLGALRQPAPPGGATGQLSNAAQSSSSSSQMVVQVSEDAPYGLIVTRVLAMDLDAGAELRYSINWARSEARNEDMVLVEQALFKDVFSMEPSEGTIKVARQLDRELFDQVKLRLQVEDIAAQTAEQVAHSYLVVRITDVNDNRPVFKKALYKAVVNENSISGTSVITVTADDRDLNKTLRYSLEGPGEALRLIRINPRSGEVTVNDKIDRELHNLINVTVRAEDAGYPHPLTGTTQLLVTVRDENDNNPIFLNASHLAQLEPAPGHAHLSGGGGHPAGPPAPKNHNMATLSPNATLIKVYRLPTLEPAPRAATAEPADLASPTEPAPTAAPSWPRLPLLGPGATAKVREDAPLGQQLAFVRAEDADLGNNGRVTYLLEAASSGGKFRIERDSGVISVAGALDRESAKQYSLIIEACDNYDLGYSTGESRRAFMQVNIQVLDVNDNAPLITTNLQSSSLGRPPGGATGPGGEHVLPTYDDVMNSPGPYEQPLAECLFINEFQPLNEPILTITATDADDPGTGNGQMDLAIVNNLPHNELFRLVPIRLPADRAEPGGAGSASGAPDERSAGADFLAGFGELAQAESAPRERGQGRLSRRSAQLEADLLAQGGNLYSRSSFASASSSSGARRPLAGSGAGLQNARRPSPAPTPPSSASTEEPATGGLVMSATMSSVRHSQLAQNLDGGEQQVHLVVSQSLKERVGNYTVLVRATDRGQPSLASVKLINVCVQDVNNHSPVFVRPPLNHTIRVLENATLGSYVAQVEATDADHGLNGELHYSLKQTTAQSNNNDWQAFKIDRLSGVISTAKLFNRQLKKYYTLRVQAQDFGKPTSLSSDIDINIVVVNSGQYQPEFDQQLQRLQFTENVAPGVEWFTLFNTVNLDDDPALLVASQSSSTVLPPGGAHANNNNWLTQPCYFIIDSDDADQVFHLDRYSHKLSNQRPIDREKKANFTLLVQATNNCNKPPSQPMYTRTIDASRLLDEPSRASPSGSGQPPDASDAAAEQAARLDELAVAGIATRGGRLSRAAARSGERDKSAEQANATARAELLVAAGQQQEDAGFNQAAVDSLLANDKSLLKVFIKVRDVNDNAPRFTQRVYTGGITTEADYGTVFMIVQALDADADANGQLVYSIVKPIKKNLVTSSGPLQANFGAANKSAANNRTAAGSQLRQRRAAPQDATTLKTTQLNFEEGLMNDIPAGDNGDDLFIINPQTGEISLNFDPQKHMKGYFEFEILANDTEGLSDSAKVFIYLLRQDQRVKFVLRLTPQELRQRLNKFRSVFGNITGAIVNIDSYKYFENHDGTVDKKKTSLFLHFVNPDDNTIIEVDKVLTLIDNNIEYLDELYKEFHVLSSEAAHLPLSSSALIDPIDQIRTGLMGVASFLALILVLVIALCLNQRTRYERQLKAATDPNPIWINGYSEQDWLSGAKASGANMLSGGQPRAVEPSVGAGIEDADYLSSANSDLNSLSGVNSVSQLHYNATATATPRDSLNSSQGRVSGSGSGSTSTTNERQLLCRANNNSGRRTPQLQQQQQQQQQQPQQQLQRTNKVQYGAVQHVDASGGCQARKEPEVVGVLKNGKSKELQTHSKQQAMMKKRSQQLEVAVGTGNVSTHSTFGAFKEVTIYTDHNQQALQTHFVSAQQQQQQQQHKQQDNQHHHLTHNQAHSAQSQTNLNNLIRTVDHQSNNQNGSNHNQPTSQVNKIASQFNAKHQAQRVNQQQQVNGATNQVYTSQQQAALNNRPQQQRSQHQQQQHIIVHANGADVNQGIIKTTIQQQHQQSGNNKNNKSSVAFSKQASVELNSGKLTAQAADQQLQQAQHQQQRLMVAGDLHGNGFAAMHQQNLTSKPVSSANITNPAAGSAATASANTADTFETNLSKLSILNLETTEL